AACACFEIEAWRRLGKTRLGVGRKSDDRMREGRGAPDRSPARGRESHERGRISARLSVKACQRFLMPRYKLTIEYDGTPFVGWQLQDNGPSVAGAIEIAIEKFTGERVALYGAGRTDAGVHAFA